MKKMLITGTSGFLGSRIADFYKNKYEIITPSHGQMDIADEESVFAYFDEYKPDMVVHCAAVSDVAQCESEPERSWKINVNGSINIAKASAKVGAKCLVCSSDQVYVGSNIESAHEEYEILQPLNLYGQGKLKAEQECLKVNPDCVMLRLSWMYDGKQDDLATGVSSIKSGDFLKNLIYSIKNNEKIGYPFYDKRGITDVYEVVENMEKAFNIPGGVYNFGSPNHINTYEAVCEMVKSAGFNPEIIVKNDEAFKENMRNMTMDQKKINSVGIYFPNTIDAVTAKLKEFV